MKHRPRTRSVALHEGGYEQSDGPSLRHSMVRDDEEERRRMKRASRATSAKSDYKVFLINQMVMMVVSPFLITQLAIATSLFFYFHTIDWLSSGMYSNTLPIIVVSAFTIFQFTSLCSQIFYLFLPTNFSIPFFLCVK